MKKDISEALVRSVMSLYDDAKTGVRLNYKLPEMRDGNVGMYHGSVLSPFPSAVVVDVTEFVREDTLSELLCVDDLVLMSETIAGLSILVVWLECRFLDTEVDGSNPGNSMLCP